MGEYEFIISLSIRHPTVAPNEISRALGIEAQHCWKVGDERRGSAGEALEGTYRETFWTARVMSDPQLASDHVTVESVLLRTLSQLRKAFDFFTDLSRSGGVAELQISVFGHEDFRLELLPESLALLGRLGLGISLNVTSYSKQADLSASAN
jgi:Domain of unknown function (DUF4279)